MRMKLALLFCSMPLLAATGALAAPTAVSTFDTDLEGWTAFTSESFFDPTATNDLPIVWDAAGGNPGGAARVTVDTPSGWAWFAAPAQFLGDKSQLLNQGTIRFDVKLENGSRWLSPDIVIAGAGMVLRTPPGSFRQPGQWTTVQGPLIPSGAWWGCVSGDGCDVTPEVFSAVLSDLTGIWLLAEFRDGAGTTPDTIWLDNVAVIPEPATAALLGIGLAGALPVAWRRRRLAEKAR